MSIIAVVPPKLKWAILITERNAGLVVYEQKWDALGSSFFICLSLVAMCTEENMTNAMHPWEWSALHFTVSKRKIRQRCFRYLPFGAPLCSCLCRCSYFLAESLLLSSIGRVRAKDTETNKHPIRKQQIKLFLVEQLSNGLPPGKSLVAEKYQVLTSSDMQMIEL